MVNGTFCDEVRSILSDVRSIRDGQNSSESILGAMQVDNKSLWRDVALLRSQHHKQRRVIEKLIQFLLSLIQNRNNVVSKKRKVRLMISATAKSGSDSGASDGALSPMDADHLASSPATSSAGNSIMGSPRAAQLVQSLCHSAIGDGLMSADLNPMDAILAGQAVSGQLGVGLGGGGGGSSSSGSASVIEVKGEQQPQQLGTMVASLPSATGFHSFVHQTPLGPVTSQPSRAAVVLAGSGNENTDGTGTSQDANGYQQLALQFSNGIDDVCDGGGGGSGSSNGSNNNNMRGAYHHVTQWAANSIYNTMAEAPAQGLGLSSGVGVFGELRIGPSCLPGLEVNQGGSLRAHASQHHQPRHQQQPQHQHHHQNQLQLQHQHQHQQPNHLLTQHGHHQHCFYS